jgi:hypothetical protein
MCTVRYELVFYIPEDGILHSRRHENLKSYMLSPFYTRHFNVTTPITPTVYEIRHKLNVAICRYMAPCSPYVNRRFRETNLLHLQGRELDAKRAAGSVGSFHNRRETPKCNRQLQLRDADANPIVISAIVCRNIILKAF